MQVGRATAAGTARFQGHFYRSARGLTVSTVGIGSYLGAMDDATDERYVEAVRTAVAGGINVIDTSLNYRNQRSERAIGKALAAVRRDQVVVCTKAGYLTPGAVPALDPDEVAGGIHCLSPKFLADQVKRSQANLELATIDVFYLHNPETQLPYLTREAFADRMQRAFEACERFVADGSIAFYGTATWDGYRRPGQLSLPELVELARGIAGEDHHFRFVQLPFNLAMTEAVDTGVLAQAAERGITVLASASILQSRLARGLPAELATMIPGLETDAQRAIQFTRSTRGITTALVGMSRAEHVRENLALRDVPPLWSE